PWRSGGAMMSMKPSPFMSATASELRHEPDFGRPSDESVNAIVLSAEGGTSGEKSARVLRKYASDSSGHLLLDSTACWRTSSVSAASCSSNQNQVYLSFFW